jgi:hypothetical protein
VPLGDRVPRVPVSNAESAVAPVDDGTVEALAEALVETSAWPPVCVPDACPWADEPPPARTAAVRERTLGRVMRIRSTSGLLDPAVGVRTRHGSSAL